MFRAHSTQHICGRNRVLVQSFIIIMYIVGISTERKNSYDHQRYG